MLFLSRLSVYLIYIRRYINLKTRGYAPNCLCLSVGGQRDGRAAQNKEVTLSAARGRYPPRRKPKQRPLWPPSAADLQAHNRDRGSKRPLPLRKPRPPYRPIICPTTNGQRPTHTLLGIIQCHEWPRATTSRPLHTPHMIDCHRRPVH